MAHTPKEDDLSLNEESNTKRKNKEIDEDKRIKLDEEQKKGAAKADWHHRNRVCKKADMYRNQYKVFVPVNQQSINNKKTPCWGGTTTIDNKPVNMNNTCPIDNWLLYVSLSKHIYEINLNSQNVK